MSGKKGRSGGRRPGAGRKRLVKPATPGTLADSSRNSRQSGKGQIDELLRWPEQDPETIAVKAAHDEYRSALEQWGEEFYRAARDSAAVNALWDKVLVAHKAAFGKETSEDLESVKRSHSEERRWERLLSLYGIKWSGLNFCGFQSSDEYSAWFAANREAMQRLYGRAVSPQQARPSNSPTVMVRITEPSGTSQT